MTVAIAKQVDATADNPGNLSAPTPAQSTAPLSPNSPHCKTVGIPKEIYPGESRVAATPKTVKTLQGLGFKVLIESGAGAAADFPDTLYEGAGAHILAKPAEVWRSADIVLKVRAPDIHPIAEHHEAEWLTVDKTLISFLWPAQHPELLETLAKTEATVLAMDAVPRISRAQKMDALSSMANIAGYRAVVEAANHFGRFFTGQITAAGKVPPAKVLVIGAGVAGLAAIGTAKSLGAIVRAFDTRPIVKEQVQSLGAEFLELEFEEDGSGAGGYAKVMSKAFIAAEMALFAQQAKDVDIIITTALIPGKPAPRLITQEMVESMRQGSVIIDMAAEQGGNCALTHPNDVYVHQGVTIVGFTDFPSRMANISSQLYSTNLCHLLKDMGGAEDYTIDLEDEVIRGALALHQGNITWPPPQRVKPSPNAQSQPDKAQSYQTQTSNSSSTIAQDTVAIVASVDQTDMGSNTLLSQWLWPGVVGLALLVIGITAPASFLTHFTIFVLACCLGWTLIWNVTPSLHTPLMSVTNAISGIIIIGGMVQILGPSNSGQVFWPTTILGAIAIFIGTINITGGFLVTQRMLNMFQK